MAPITDPSLPPCASNAAERTTASVADLTQIARAPPPFYEGAHGESIRQRGQRARLPQSKALGSNRRSCAFKPNS